MTTLSEDTKSTSKNSGSNKPRIFYTDGGAHNEPGELKGLGAWAFVEYSEKNRESGELMVYGGYEGDTTNNRTEMLAIINAMRFCHMHSTLNIISDSGYVVKGYNHPSYLDLWMKNGWRTSSKKPVMNMDLWNEIVGYASSRGVKFILCRGHFKDPNPTHRYWNSVVDKACTFIMQNEKYHVPYLAMRYDTNINKIISAEVVQWQV